MAEMEGAKITGGDHSNQAVTANREVFGIPIPVDELEYVRTGFDSGPRAVYRGNRPCHTGPDWDWVLTAGGRWKRGPCRLGRSSCLGFLSSTCDRLVSRCTPRLPHSVSAGPIQWRAGDPFAGRGGAVGWHPCPPFIIVGSRGSWTTGVQGGFPVRGTPNVYHVMSSHDPWEVGMVSREGCACSGRTVAPSVINTFVLMSKCLLCPGGSDHPRAGIKIRQISKSTFWRATRIPYPTLMGCQQAWIRGLWRRNGCLLRPDGPDQPRSSAFALDLPLSGRRKHLLVGISVALA
eukprot:gene8357-biopygen13661